MANLPPGTKFEPIKDTALKKMTVEDRVKALGGVHLAYMDKFYDVLSPLIVEGLLAAKAAGRGMHEVCFVLADRQDEFFKQNYVEINAKTGEIVAGHGTPAAHPDVHRWLVPAYFLDVAGVKALIEEMAPLGKLLCEAIEPPTGGPTMGSKNALRDLDQLARNAREEGVKAWGARRFQAWWMYSDVLAKHPISLDQQHPHYSTWMDMQTVSEYGPKVLVIIGNAASAQIIQPMPDKPTPG